MGGVFMGLMLAAATGSREPPVAPRDDPMRLTLDVADSESLPDLGAFLAERARDTWGAEAVALDTEPSRFRVSVSWLAGRSAEVSVDEGNARLAERILVVTDAGAAKLTIWLLVKSTIKRALVGSRPPAPPAPPPAAVRVEAAGDEAPAPEPLSFATMVVFSLGQPELFSVGPGIGVEWSPWPRVAIGGELGYRISPGVVGLLVHHVPVRVSAGWVVDPGRVATLGIAATADVKVPVAESRYAAALGLETGGFLALHLPLSRPGASFLLRGSVHVRPVRQRYVIDGDVVTEQLWDASVSTGVSW